MIALRPAGPAATHCPYCAMQCGMHVARRAATFSVSGNSSFPVNKGGLCVKGWSAADTLAHPDRLLNPLMRNAARSAGRQPPGRPRSIAWRGTSSACRHATAPDAVGVFGSGALTNEKAYLLGKFARVALGTVEHRLQRALLHVLGGRGSDARASASIAACHSRSRTSRTRTWCCSPAATSPRRCPR